MTVFLVIVVAFVIITFMIFTHELGHFYAARLCKVKVDQFSIGFGPEIKGWDRGETRYSLKWILAGGSVRICGMDPDEEVSEGDFPRSYYGAPYWKRAVIVVAGSLVHVLIAMILFFLFFWPIGYPVLTGRIGEVQKTVEFGKSEELPGPAYEAGLKKGDLVTSVDGVEVEGWSELSGELSSHPDETVTIEYERDGRKNTVDVELLKTSDDRGYLGIEVDSNDYFREKMSPLEAAWESVKTTGQVSWLMIKGIGKLFTPETFKVLIGLEERTEESPRSVVGAVQLSYYAAAQNFSIFVFMIAQLFLFLAIFNLIPLPPFDGGHLLVIIVEKLFHKEIDLKKLAPVAWAVIVILSVVALRLALLDLFNPLGNPFAP
ncbi:MAG: site-2 protease family protein [Actinobacteria bacterium]|nr:site-2 protease family protein [Actinomycetota bacterium]